MIDLDQYPVITHPAEAYLNPRQRQDYRSERESCLHWLLTRGKKPAEAVGYAEGTVKPRCYRMDRFYRFVWEREGGYTTNLSHDHADAWMDHLAQRDVSATHKQNCQKSLAMLYKWLHHERGLGEWEPPFRFSSDSSTQPRDYLTRDERKAIRDAALEYGSVPSYNNLTPSARDRWKQYLAQRFEKPKAEVTPKDWDRANGWKIPSLIWTMLDAGLRPVEVERASLSWVDCDNSLLRIPKEDSAKTREHWVVGVTDRTAEHLSKWCQQRRNYAQYDDTDLLWLTREGNPYGSSALRSVLQRLCDIAGIDTEHRQMSAYTIRHSVGTFMTREEDLAAAQAQLRHRSPQTTMKYDSAPPEARRRALDRMG